MGSDKITYIERTWTEIIRTSSIENSIGMARLSMSSSTSRAGLLPVGERRLLSRAWVCNLETTFESKAINRAEYFSRHTL